MRRTKTIFCCVSADMKIKMHVDLFKCSFGPIFEESHPKMLSLVLVSSDRAFPLFLCLLSPFLQLLRKKAWCAPPFVSDEMEMHNPKCIIPKQVAYFAVQMEWLGCKHPIQVKNKFERQVVFCSDIHFSLLMILKRSEKNKQTRQLMYNIHFKQGAGLPPY